MTLRILALAVLSLVCRDAFSQESPREEDLAVELGDLIGRLDLDVPDSPAFAVLGIAPQNVINPDTPAELASAFILGDDGNGNGQEGLALEFRPYLMAMGDDITIGDYYRNQWLSRTSLSFAKSSGTDDSDRTDRTAIGLSFTPIDKRDPLTSMKVNACVKSPDDIRSELATDLIAAIEARTAAEQAGDPAARAQAQARIDALEAQQNRFMSGERKQLLEERLDTCLSEFQAATRNEAQLQLGIAYHESQVEDINESGAAAWISYAHPLAGGSLIAHARYSDSVVVPGTSDPGDYSVKDETLAGLRFRRGDERRAVLFEASYVDQEDQAGLLDDSYSTVLVGAEFRLFDELWVQIAYGDTFGSNQDASAAVSGQFRWAASKSRLWRGADRQ